MPYIHDGIMETKIAIHVDRNKIFTTVILVGDKHTAVGVSKRHREDTYSRQVGIDIALSRALRELADRVRADAGDGALALKRDGGGESVRHLVAKAGA